MRGGAVGMFTVKYRRGTTKFIKRGGQKKGLYLGPIMLVSYFGEVQIVFHVVLVGSHYPFNKQFPIYPKSY